MSLDLLKKEIAFRASRRGTKELDLFFEPLTRPEILANVSESDLHQFRDILLEGENNLISWLTEGVPAPVEKEAVFQKIRALRCAR